MESHRGFKLSRWSLVQTLLSSKSLLSLKGNLLYSQWSIRIKNHKCEKEPEQKEGIDTEVFTAAERRNSNTCCRLISPVIPVYSYNKSQPHFILEVVGFICLSIALQKMIKTTTITYIYVLQSFGAFGNDDALRWKRLAVLVTCSVCFCCLNPSNLFFLQKICNKAKYILPRSLRDMDEKICTVRICWFEANAWRQAARGLRERWWAAETCWFWPKIKILMQTSLNLTKEHFTSQLLNLYLKRSV